VPEGCICRVNILQCTLEGVQVVGYKSDNQDRSEKTYEIKYILYSSHYKQTSAS